MIVGWLVFEMTVPDWWWVPPTNNQPHNLQGVPEAWSAAVTESFGTVALYSTSQNDCLLTVTKEGDRWTSANTTLVAECTGPEIPRMDIDDDGTVHRVDPTIGFEFAQEFDRCHYDIDYYEWPGADGGSISFTHRCYWP